MIFHHLEDHVLKNLFLNFFVENYDIRSSINNHDITLPYMESVSRQSRNHINGYIYIKVQRERKNKMKPRLTAVIARRNQFSLTLPKFTFDLARKFFHVVRPDDKVVLYPFSCNNKVHNRNLFQFYADQFRACLERCHYIVIFQRQFPARDIKPTLLSFYYCFIQEQKGLLPD